MPERKRVAVRKVTRADVIHAYFDVERCFRPPLNALMSPMSEEVAAEWIEFLRVLGGLAAFYCEHVIDPLFRSNPDA